MRLKPFVLAPLLVVLGFLFCGCDGPVEVNYADRGARVTPVPLQGANSLPHPADVSIVPATVESIELPPPESAHANFDSATADFSIPPGSIPGHGGTTKIILHYDPFVRSFYVGQHLHFEFRANGSFWNLQAD